MFDPTRYEFVVIGTHTEFSFDGGMGFREFLLNIEFKDAALRTTLLPFLHDEVVYTGFVENMGALKLHH